MVNRHSIRLWKGICLGMFLLTIPLVTVYAIAYLDPSFGAPEGYIWLSGNYPNTSIKSDGRILVMIQDQQHLVQLATDGSIDKSFGTDGLVTFPAELGIVAALTPDGKIIVAGKCDLQGNGLVDDVSLQRLLPDGKPDPSFNSGSPICRSVNASLPLLFIDQVSVQPDGKILVVAHNVFGGDIIVGYSLVARFDTTGNLDPTFGTDGIFLPEVPSTPGGQGLAINGLAIQSGGNILLVGTVFHWTTPWEMPVYLVVIRLTSSGQHDTTFNGTGVFIYYNPATFIRGCNLATQQSGRVIIEGSEEIPGISTYFLLGLTSGGTIDTGFGESGRRQIPEGACNLLILPNQSIVTAGFADPNLVIRMFSADGVADSSFANSGSATYNYLGSPSELDMEPNGQILISSGSSLSNQAFVARMASDIGPRPSFEDVNFIYWANSWIERLYRAGITGGCASNPLRYCPENTVTRDQMAVFLERGIHGSSYAPPAVGASTGFNDVPTIYWSAAWIKQLAADGITSGCGGGNYCPGSAVTRAQMAVFLLKAKYGSAYTPPAVGSSTGFSDVPTTYWAAAWIKQLAVEGITSGCGTGIYCPESPVTRAQMAVFLVRTFNLS